MSIILIKQCSICGRNQRPTDGVLPDGSVRGNCGWHIYQWTCGHGVSFVCPDHPGEKQVSVSCSQCGCSEAYC